MIEEPTIQLMHTLCGIRNLKGRLFYGGFIGIMLKKLLEKVTEKIKCCFNFRIVSRIILVMLILSMIVLILILDSHFVN